MVQALLTLDENTNRVLNVVKAKYNLKDKGEAVKFLVSRYIDEVDEPELRPEFIKKIQKIVKNGKYIEYDSVNHFRKKIEHA